MILPLLVLLSPAVVQLLSETKSGEDPRTPQVSSVGNPICKGCPGQWTRPHVNSPLPTTDLTSTAPRGYRRDVLTGVNTFLKKLHNSWNRQNRLG